MAHAGLGQHDRNLALGPRRPLAALTGCGTVLQRYAHFHIARAQPEYASASLVKDFDLDFVKFRA